MSNVSAIIITIGDELLIGQTIDTNSAWLGQRLNELGIDLVRRVAVGDSKDAIVAALDEELPKAQIILITGGLGPTSDDITKPLLCEYFGGKLVVNERVHEHLRNIFEKRNRPVLARNMKQAEVPDNCTVLFNRMGTAPGMLFEKDGKIIISMPGVPFEMMSITEDEVLPLLRKRFVSDALLHRTILTAGEGESYIAEKILNLEEALPEHIKLAYLPDSRMVRLRLTGRGNDKDALAIELQARQDEIATRLEDIVVVKEDLPMEQVLARLLTEKGATLGLAESCTGGQIANKLTNVVGATNFFAGSMVCYRNEIKEKVLGVKRSTLEKYGAVSEETAIEMAEGAKALLNCDYAFSVTGQLSPGGESDGVEVGTVWFAVTGKGHTKAHKIKLFYDRQRNKDMAVQMGMLMIWKFINGKI